MRRRTPVSWWLVGILVPLLLLGAEGGDLAKEVDDGMDVYFRDTDLGALAKQDVARFPVTDAGESDLIKRSFPDAPPSISHTVEDMYPITGDDNECLECHHPDNAVDGSDIPVPKTHFRRPMMGKGGEDDLQVWVVKGYADGEDMSGTRHNCNMCHTPQADNVRTVKSTFERVKGKATQ